jgi:sensor histidine kinase YesM
MIEMKMPQRLKPVWSPLGFSTLLGLAFGIPFGYVATKYQVLPIGYAAAIGICLGCAYSIQIFQAVNEAYLYPRFKRLGRGRNLASQLVSSALAHFLGWLLTVWVASLVIGFELFKGAIFVWLVSFIAGVLLIHLIHQLVSFFRELREKDVLEEKLKTLAAQAELKALRAQINPHFLFNSLNTIASLVNSDPLRAEESVERLADIFRYALSASYKEFVTLRDELDFIDSYLEIEKARFGERLEVTRAISKDILDTLIPSLILQPLVENSIKHGYGENGKMRIAITSYMNGELVQLVVTDEGRGVPDHIIRGVYTSGTGLRNVSERLHRVYGEGYGLELKENTPSGTIAIMTIPRERKCS